ncbi:hypothetical protein NM208_g3579 [Fusarium decemcellulare]|uniref:Uncharacterized protein n=1 Tax=Fusarium decemcellulare TaxID=57161 RepID=A0ACC1SNR4_9HYPO|nr:hypothetical protein NM208_g3579 [Fusarium decemcellulare]
MDEFAHGNQLPGPIMAGDGQPEVPQPQEFDEVPVDLDLGFSPTGLDDDYFDLLNLSQFDVQPEDSSSDTNDLAFDTSFCADNASLDPSSLVPNEMARAAVDPRESSLLVAVPQQLTTTNLSTASINVQARDHNESKNNIPPKIGTRFSRESLQILKRWLALHSRHPYPSEEDNALLQRQTGLSKTQISNWFSNARRKRKAQAPKPNFSRTGTAVTEPVNVPRRPDTPALRSNLDPLRRWVDSPPEDEPASAAAIARAVASDYDSRLYSFTLSDDGSGCSLGDASSATSVRTSSGSSFASSQSHASEASFGSFRIRKRLRDQRRRKKRPMPKREENPSLGLALKPYQCTFCTETYRTKYDWQRHEKALHLSLEMWICASDGPRVTNPQTNELCCVFCGKANPDDPHVEGHNYSVCKVKSPDERTFYRKDHLNQHLRLVHNAQFLDWSMKPWKVSTSEVRSRCGFCGITMNTWSARVDHLAEHFKTGKMIADWKGDWGFEAPVLDMLKNAIPPYLIEMERISPFPFVASCAPTESPRTAYELITLELGYFVINHKEETRRMPSDKDLQLEACRIIFASEVMSMQGISAEPSWLRDLLMASAGVARQAQFAPLRRGAENKLCILKINGKDNLFEECPLELNLHEFVRAKSLLGRVVTDDELQNEACNIISRIEEGSASPSDDIANWLVRLIMSSTAWLSAFRQRAELPQTPDSNAPTTHDGSTSPTIHGYSRLEQILGKYMQDQRAIGIEPSDEALGREARKILYESHNSYYQTAADNVNWLAAFRERHSQSPEISTEAQPEQLHNLSNQDDRPAKSPRAFEAMMKKTFFLNDSNCYRLVAQELTRFVTSTMSPNNPNRHVPTDAELQYQARWILFDSDDPWNQTAADNEEWLERFKRDVGILPPGPGLSLNAVQ